MTRTSNRLSRETSPYLLQHAHNPVDWYPWGNEAFEAANAAQLPILVSIGYATCHWCHVMERESFEDESVAAFMNANFINIKVDREERPDVDAVYMEAVQAIAGHGGWPLHCFLTPERKPFFGGTYFPNRPLYGRPSWIQVLRYLSQAWHAQREQVLNQADRLVTLIAGNEKNFITRDISHLGIQEAFGVDTVRASYEQMRRSFDRENGGFGGPPKFPGTMALQFLLEYGALAQEKEATAHALFSLDQMIKGGIFDQIGGGFSRYATDAEWLVPHFEKMLYDNALLVSVMADAYRITQQPIYSETIVAVLDFVRRELTGPEGGFYSALDADSEGVEGKYYVWDRAAVDAILGEESELFCAFYDITPEGNWEHTNILHRRLSLEAFASEKGWDPAVLRQQFDRNRAALKAVRDGRPRPLLDDKVILSWNALMCSAFARACLATGVEAYGETAVRNLTFLFRHMKEANGTYRHTWKAGVLKYPAFLDDLAFLLQACLDVYELAFDPQWLENARALREEIQQHFFDPDDDLFFYTSDVGEDEPGLIVRKKEVFDNALPSGNAIMVRNLQRLWGLTGDEKCREHAITMLKRLSAKVQQYPTTFAMWLSGILAIAYPPREVAVVGKQYRDLARSLQGHFIPFLSFMASETANAAYPLLQDRSGEGETSIYVCEGFVCHRPVTSITEALSLLRG